MRAIIRSIIEQRSRKRLLRLPHVRIASSAKYNSTRITMHPSCTLEIGEGSIIEGSLIAERDGIEMIIGRNTFIGGSIIASASRIDIGDDVLISWGCTIVDHNSHSLSWEHRSNDVVDWHKGRFAKDWTHVPIGNVKIHNKSWIGVNAIILKGVEVGEGAVVGAGSVVTKSVAPWTVVAGNPAKAIRSLPAPHSPSSLLPNAASNT